MQYNHHHSNFVHEVSDENKPPRKLANKKSSSQKHGANQGHNISRNTGQLFIQNTAQPNALEQFGGLNATQFNQLSTQQIGKIPKGVTPNQQNISKMLQKTGSQVGKEGNQFGSPNIKKYVVQGQSHQQLPSQKANAQNQKMILTAGGPMVINQEMLIDNQSSGPHNAQYQNFNSLKQAGITKQNFIGAAQAQHKSSSNSRLSHAQQLQNQQKFLAQTTKSKANGKKGQHLKQPQNYPGFQGGRIGSHNSRQENSHELSAKHHDQNCYTDEELQNVSRQDIMNKASSMQRTGSSRQQRRVKAATTKEQSEEAQRVNQSAMNSYANANDANKSLYTNISLREISQSPDQRTSGINSGKVINISKTGQMTQQKGATQTNTYSQQNLKNQQRTHSSQDQIQRMDQIQKSSGSIGNAQNQMELQNQFNLKNYLNQLNPNQQQQQSKVDKNNSVLNIKTVQDINIYNNSFIVNSTNLPPGFTAQQVQAQLMQETFNSQTQTNNGKKALKLRKELSGLQTNLNQARSVSQGRLNNNRAVSGNSTNNVSSGQSRNAPGGLTEYNSYGALQTNPSQYSKLSKAYENYNQNIRTQNIQNLQQNPNQKRVLNPPGKMFGNLSALSDIHKKHSLSNKQGNYQQNVYSNNASTGKPQSINKMIKNMISSNTSRHASRADSRQGARVINSKTTDQKILQANLNNIALEGNLKNQTNNMNLQQMKLNYLSNQKILISNQNMKGNEHMRPVTQIDNINPHHFLIDKQNMMSDGGLSHHNSSQHVKSQQYQNAVNNYIQNKNINSFELRKHSLQDIKMRGMHENKFKNQIQNLSSDLDRERVTMMATQENGMINSMSINNQQFFKTSKGPINRNKTQDTKSQKILNTNEKSKESINRKVQSEFQEQHKTLQASFLKIQKSCQEIQASNKEEMIKFNLKHIENLQTKISHVKKQICLQAQNQHLEQITEGIINLNQETIILKALCHLDIGQNYECIQELKKIQEVKNATATLSSAEGVNTLSSDALLAANFASQGAMSNYLNGDINKSQVLKNALLIMSIAQQRMGEHKASIDTVTHCINLFNDFKDAYVVRGQKYLLTKALQNALQDFIKFDQMITSEISDIQFQAPGGNQSSKMNFLILQSCVARECLGDTYKKMKRYKQASKCYQDSIAELQKLTKNKGSDFYKKQIDKIQHTNYKLKMKVAMCCYYQGQIKKAILHFEELIKYYHKFDPTSLRVQSKAMKCNFYFAKSMLSINEKNQNGSQDYLQALTKLTFCTNEEIDPELHELYSGNAHFEVFKIFLKQKDIYNAHEYLQKATDNNFNSKRLSLYRDFTEGVVYLMKRKIKKGVQILTDLLEVLINGQKEIEKKNKVSEKEKDAKDPAHKKRYDMAESGDLIQPNEAGLVATDDKSTINSKANQIASGRFTKEMYDFLILNIYIYRSYGYVAIEKYEHALEDLKKAKKINPKYIDRSTIYNKWLSRGILKMDTEEYLMASRFFGKASLRFPNNKDAFCLNVISIVRSYSYSLMNMYMDNEQKYQKVSQTREFLNVAIDCCCQEQKQPSLYFFRGLLNYQLHNFYEALNDFNVAIAEEEEPTGQFHLARGRTYACLSILDEAMKDLSIALELDETLHEAYIFRGKCAYLLGDNNLAFHDFQKLIISDQKNPLVHIYAGNLLMTTGAYADAIKAFDNADTVQQTPLSSFQRIRCFCALSNLESAFEQMQLAMHQAPNEKFMQYDYKVLLQLLSVVRSFAFTRGDNNEVDENGVLEQHKIIQNCIQQLGNIIQQFEGGEHMKLTKDQSPMTIQIIPNVNRIKIEKNLVIQKLQPHKDGIPQFTPLTAQEQKELKGVPNHGYYRENIFSLEEMFLYRAIFNIYVKKYQEALRDIERAWRQHFTQKREAAGKRIIDTDSDNMYGKFPMSQLVSPIESLRSGSQKTDLSEVGLCSLNIGEYSLNLMIIHIQLGNWDEALKKVNEVLTTAPANSEFSKSIRQLLLVRALIFQELGNVEKQNQDMTMYLKNFGQINKNKQNAVLVEPFETKGRICNQFDPVVLNFGKAKGKSSFDIWIRPSFSMPFIKPPNMIPNINEDVIQSEFNLKQIDAPMPEAPWVRFCINKDKFQPQNYVYQLSPRWQMKKEQLDQEPKLPDIAGGQKFVSNYYNRDNLLFYDEKVMEDVDDLSDTEKVSLISDIEVNDEPQESTDKGSTAQSKLNIDGEDLLITDIEQLDLDKEKTIINQANTKKVVRVNNGIQLQKSKQRCGHTRACESCYFIPQDPYLVNITNQDMLIQYLAMSTDDQEKQRRINIAQSAAKGAATQDNKPLVDDTVTEEEYGSSDDEATKESAAKKKDKDSKYTHSRFSSQIADDLDEMNVLMGDMNINDDANIDDLEVQVNGKKLQQDNRQLQQKKQGDKKVNMPMKFQDDIDSIQHRTDNGENTDGLVSSPIQKQKQNKASVSQNERPAADFDDPIDDGMVLMASKNANQKKKKSTGKKLGIANLNVHTLKKNKLAIAFNNLEMDKTEDEKESDN